MEEEKYVEEIDEEQEEVVEEKKPNDIVLEIKRNLEKNNLIYGIDTVKKMLIAGKIEKIIVSFNLPDKVKEELTQNASLLNIPVQVIDKTNEEIGTLCKKPFAVTVIGVKK